MALDLYTISADRRMFVPIDTPGETVTVANLSGATVYYGNQYVSSASYSGTVAVGDSLALGESTFFRSVSESVVSVNRVVVIEATGGGGVTTNDKGVVEHGSDSTPARPAGYDSIEWIGTVAPDNATADDTWVNPNDTVDAPVVAHAALNTNVHGISDTTKIKAIVNHDADATVLRPTGFTSVEWIGTVAPFHASGVDTWINPNDGTGGGRLLQGAKVDMTDALAVTLGSGAFYLADDENGGTLYRGTGVTWVQAAAPVVAGSPSWLPPKMIAAMPLTQGWSSAALGTANKFYMSRIPFPVSGTLDKLAVAVGTTVGGHLLAAVYRIAGDGSRERLWVMPSSLSTTGLSAGWVEVATGIGLALDASHTYLFGVMVDDTTTQMMRVNLSQGPMGSAPSGWWSVNGSSSVIHSTYTAGSFAPPSTIADGSVAASATAVGMAGRLL